MTEVIKTHRGEQEVGITIVQDAPYYSTFLEKLFDTKKLALEAEAEENERLEGIKLAKKIETLKRIGVGGAIRR